MNAMFHSSASLNTHAPPSAPLSLSPSLPAGSPVCSLGPAGVILRKLEARSPQISQGSHYIKSLNAARYAVTDTCTYAHSHRNIHVTHTQTPCRPTQIHRVQDTHTDIHKYTHLQNAHRHKRGMHLHCTNHPLYIFSTPQAVP